MLFGCRIYKNIPKMMRLYADKHMAVIKFYVHSDLQETYRTNLSKKSQTSCVLPKSLLHYNVMITDRSNTQMNGEMFGKW